MSLFKQKRRHHIHYTGIILALGLTVSVITFGLFAAFMMVSLSWCRDETYIQMEFDMPAWMFVASLAFIGLIASVACIMFFEKKMIFRLQERHLRILERKLEALVRAAKKGSVLLKETEKLDEPEHLPYESMDDLLDGFVSMSDQEIEALAVQLLHREDREDELAVCERDDILERNYQKEKRPNVIPFITKSKETDANGETEEPQNIPEMRRGRRERIERRRRINRRHTRGRF